MKKIVTTPPLSRMIFFKGKKYYIEGRHDRLAHVVRVDQMPSDAFKSVLGVILRFLVPDQFCATRIDLYPLRDLRGYCDLSFFPDRAHLFPDRPRHFKTMSAYKPPFYSI